MIEHVTDENQLSTADGRIFPHTDCGLAVAASMAIDAGIAPSEAIIAHMEQWYITHGDTPADGTGIPVNVAFLQSLGLDAVAWNGGQDVVDGFLAQGFRVGQAIYSNSYGYPYSGPDNVGHWLELCWATPTGYHVMQPVGGMEVDYTRQTVADNSQLCGFVVRHDYRTTAPTTVTTVPGGRSGGQPLMDPTLIFRGFVDLLTFLAFGRNATQQELDWAVARAHAVGAGQAEWYTEEALAGDVTVGPAIHNAVAKLHQLAAS